MNLTMAEVVLYKEQYPIIDDIKDICEQYKSIKKYAIIEHNRDDNKPHYHLAMHFGTSFNTNQLCTMFNIQTNQIERIKGRWADVLKYLTHENAPTKYQYDTSQVVSNFDFNLDKEEKNIDFFLDRCSRGLIKPYERDEKIPHVMICKHKTKFDVAFSIGQRERAKQVEQSGGIQVYFFSGATGTGKTSFAKYLAQKMKKRFYVTSSNNDPLQDYQGEEVLIIDDMRDDTFTFSTLLKILDNHTRTSIQSRYNNKFFVGDTIIITTAIPITEWYKEYSSQHADNKDQLYRRVNFMYLFEKDTVAIYKSQYTNGRYSYHKDVVIPNPLSAILKELNKMEMPDVAKQVMMQLINTSADLANEYDKQAYIDNRPSFQEVFEDLKLDITLEDEQDENDK